MTKTKVNNETVVIYPSVLDYSSASDYFKNFKDLNLSKGFGYRSLVEKIKWPVGYLQDLIAERRALTVERSLQFAEIANFNSLETNRLVFMGLASGKSGRTADYFKKTLMMEMNLSRTFVDDSDGEFTTEPEVEIIKKIIQINRGNIDIDKVCRSISYSNKSKDDIEKIINYLVCKGDVKVIDGKLAVENEDAIKNRHLKSVAVIEKHKRWNERFFRYLENPMSPSFMFSGVFELCSNGLQEYAQRCIALANWLSATSLKSSQSISNSPDLNLIQVDLNSYTAIKGPAKKIGKS